MADFFRRGDRDTFDRRDDEQRGNNFDRRYTDRSGGYFDRPSDGRAMRSTRDTDERLNRTLPPISDPYAQQPIQQQAQYQQPVAQQYAQTPAFQPQQSVQNVNISNVILYQPKNYADVQELIDHLVKHEPAIVEFSGLPDEDGQRILDFLSGAIYALGGSMQRISGTIFLLTPTGVSISAGGDIAKSIEERRNKR